MSIEKSITLIVVAFIATLLAWVIFSREDRVQGAPRDETTTEKRASLRDLQDRRRGGGRKIDFENGRAGEWKTPANKRPGRKIDPSTSGKVVPPTNGRPGAKPGGPGKAPRDRRTVKVRRGDSFYRIAQRELGDGRRYLEIVKANPGVDPMRLKPGQELVLPAATSRPTPPPAGGEIAAGTRSYTVRRGDTLSGIAKRFYGTATQWPRLLEANKDRLSSPKRLRPGMTVVIP